MKKLILLLVLLLMMTGCQKKQMEDIYVLYTNDVHCNLDGDMNYATLSAYKKELQSEHKYVVLVDNGDYTQGKPIGVLTEGSAIIDIMNMVPYDIAIVGNHEFDYGMEVLKNNLDNAKFQVILSSVSYEGTKTNTFENIEPYTIKDFDGTKVAFIGAVTPMATSSSAPDNFMENGEIVYDFGIKKGASNYYKDIQDIVDEVIKKGADYVVLMSHLGSTSTYSPYSSYDVIANTKGIDVVLDAHEHAEIIGDRVMNLENKEVILSSTGTGMSNIGQLIIKTDGSLETVLISGLEAKDQEVQSFIDETTAQFDEYLNTVVGHSDFDLSINEGEYRISRSRECNIGNLVADANRWFFGAEIGIVNGGGVRNTIPSGDISLGSCLSVAPFSNELSYAIVTGQMLADALEYSSRKTENYIGIDGSTVGENGGFLQVSGIRYTIDTSKKPDIELDENGMLVSISGERRICDLMIEKDGKYVPVEMDKEYTLAGSDFLIYQNGDGLTAFANAKTITRAGATDVDVIVKYIKEELKGVIPEKYRTVEGRITVK